MNDEYDEDYYFLFAYPQGVNSPQEFIGYLENTSRPFILLKEYKLFSRYKYCIEEDAKTAYYNAGAFQLISQDEIEVMSRTDYHNRLKEVIQTKCIHCEFFDRHCKPEEQNFGLCKGLISLDGYCRSFKEKN